MVTGKNNNKKMNKKSQFQSDHVLYSVLYLKDKIMNGNKWFLLLTTIL